MTQIGAGPKDGNAGRLTDEGLRAALERDHRVIDAGIEPFAASGAPGAGDHAALAGAMSGLRRHIYVEEEFLFPPLLDAGLVGPILVMLREHAQIWRTLDWIDLLVTDNAADEGLEPACQELMALLQRHNTKEEMILYAQADDIVDASTAARLLGVLASGHLPEGWVCQNL